MRKPRVFVSSTCYDLGQVRDDLKAFIEQDVGYEAILSEHSSFPVSPDKTTIENCRAAVRSTDLLILLVGGRYGHIDQKTDRSITNAEYVEARSIGLPIYVFVDKVVEALMPSWQANPELTHPAIESPRVFEFLEELKGATEWIFSFERAQEVIDTLRIQWSYQFTLGLEARRLFREQPLPQRLGLTGNALEIAVRKEELWEFTLYLCLLERELERRISLKRDLGSAFTTQTVEHFADQQEFGEWVQKKITASERLIANWNKIVDQIGDSFGEPGVSGDVERIVYVTSRLGAVYQAALEWALEFHEIHVPSRTERLCELCSHLLDDVIDSFQRARADFESFIDAAKRLAPGEPMTHKFNWAITVPEQVSADISAEIERLGGG